MVPQPRLAVIASALHANVTEWMVESQPIVSRLRTNAELTFSLLVDGPPDGHRQSIIDDVLGRAPVEHMDDDVVESKMPDYDDIHWTRGAFGSWAIFFSIFVGLLFFDHLVLHKRHEVISFQRAGVYVIFWICCAGAFNVYVWLLWGKDAAFNWGSGYILEWMLSMDNLFVFHMVFNIYGTPDHLKHKPLFYGIVGAIVFRLLFFLIGEWLFHASHWMHLVFGTFLVYTGIKAGITDEDEEDPTQHPVVKWMAEHLPLLNAYDECGSFFVHLPIDPKTGEVILPALAPAKGAVEEPMAEPDIVAEAPRTRMKDGQVQSPHGSEGSSEDGAGPRKKSIPVMDLSPKWSKKAEFKEYKREWRATMLVLVVLCLEITDLLFALDSVSAIIAQIPDLYLAFTACVFAMLGLRATFFVIDELIRMFTLLKYGVAAILVFIGVKLVVSKMIYIPPSVVCFILFGTIGTCVAVQVLMDNWKKEDKILSARQQEGVTVQP
mmetsp:Transcript_9282/g.20791  ORF Transcript_9282/g.20791 Transcript_9282/m.20791 type:complete len:492 (+) Transcript_9282:117-1592(+)|eukprot:CAMPEP_0178439982 /NCGR_PEP_ID=MMETSP0689_2-20121128/36490_1 /TAXON_ID=160604 /ORGANISM="Amphidinium massartii, Strain CS-259" /LENGTH=491 /DNA_ID=CAMNT_0020062635 /DNA_START=40 /DNA_END=1512 /DNA_ORIENTATION=+